MFVVLTFQRDDTSVLFLFLTALVSASVQFSLGYFSTKFTTEICEHNLIEKTQSDEPKRIVFFFYSFMADFNILL